MTLLITQIAFASGTTHPFRIHNSNGKTVWQISGNKMRNDLEDVKKKKKNYLP